MRTCLQSFGCVLRCVNLKEIYLTDRGSLYENVDSETCNSINLSKALLWEIMWKYYCLPQKTFWCKKLANLQCIPCFIAMLHSLTGLGVSELRDDPNYIRFYMNWTRFITTALIPITGKYHLNDICQIKFYTIFIVPNNYDS